MAYTRVYPDRINWENEPSVQTPINAVNLNKIDYAVYEHDGTLNTWDLSKANQSDLLLSVKSIDYDDETGVFVFTWQNGTTKTVDLNIEKIPVSFSMDANGIITMETDDGTTYTADVGSLIKLYTFNDSAEIDFTTTTDASGNKTITAGIVNGSVTENKLQPNFLADCRAEKTAAQTARTGAETAQGEAEDSAEDAEAWAVGQRNGVDVPSTDPTYHNNSKYWSEQSAAQTLAGLSDVNIDNSTLTNEDVLVYNDTDNKWENAPSPKPTEIPEWYKLKDISELDVPDSDYDRSIITGVVYKNQMWLIMSYDFTSSTSTYDIISIDSNDVHTVHSHPEWAYRNMSSIPRLVVYNNELYCLGAYSDNKLYKYDDENDTWNVATTLPYNPYGGAVGIEYDGKLHIFGGNGVRPHYAWNGSTWYTIRSSNISISSCYALTPAVFDNKIYIQSGTTLWSYTSGASDWVQVMSTDYARPALMVYDNKLLSVMTNREGYQTEKPNALQLHCVQLKPSTSSWSSTTIYLPFIPGAILNFNEEIHIFGPYTTDSSVYKGTELTKLHLVQNSNGLSQVTDYIPNDVNLQYMYGGKSHIEGDPHNTVYPNTRGHAEGNLTSATGSCSHAEGASTIARATCAHAEGMGTIANYECQSVCGKYNSTRQNTYFIVGNGTSDTARSNAFEVYTDGSFSTDNGVTSVKTGTIMQTNGYLHEWTEKKSSPTQTQYGQARYDFTVPFNLTGDEMIDVYYDTFGVNPLNVAQTGNTSIVVIFSDDGSTHACAIRLRF